jgi:hypothetical protein
MTKDSSCPYIVFQKHPHVREGLLYYHNKIAISSKLKHKLNSFFLLKHQFAKNIGEE